MYRFPGDMSEESFEVSGDGRLYSSRSDGVHVCYELLYLLLRKEIEEAKEVFIKRY